MGLPKFRIPNCLYLFPSQAGWSGSGDASSLMSLWRRGLAARMSETGYESRITSMGLKYCIEHLSDEISDQLRARNKCSDSVALWAAANDDAEQD